MERSAPESIPGSSALLWWCLVGSIAAHVLILQVLPWWTGANNAPPLPLTVELREPPVPEIEPPKPLPLETRPIAQERPKPAPQKPVPPAQQENPRTSSPAAPMVTS